MSTATSVPETWELTGDDARRTLLRRDASSCSETRSSGCGWRTASVTLARSRS